MYINTSTTAARHGATHVIVVDDADVVGRLGRVRREDDEAVALLARDATRVQDLEVLVHAQRRLAHVVDRQALAVTSTMLRV